MSLSHSGLRGLGHVLLILSHLPSQVPSTQRHSQMLRDRLLNAVAVIRHYLTFHLVFETLLSHSEYSAPNSNP